MQIEIESSASTLHDDWPRPGSIDLAVHDLPHASSTKEWWYVNSHLIGTDGREFSLFAAFFRVDTTGEGAQERRYSHFLTWALVDPDGQRFFPRTLLDRATPDAVLKEIDCGRSPHDDRLGRALREVLERGRVPLPDQLLTREARVDIGRLALDFDGNRFTKDHDGSYELELASETADVGCRLRFTLEKPVVRHGNDGVVRGLDGDQMFYYFSPRCRVEGSLLVDGSWLDVARGTGWYDHEFGEHREASEGFQAKVAWNWIAAQLDNGYEVSAFDLFNRRE